jgi:hypothetical protein
VTLGDVIADTGNAKREGDEVGFCTAGLDQLGHFVGLHVAEVAIQQRGGNADLGLVKVTLLKAESPVKRFNPALPAVGERGGIPIERGGGHLGRLRLGADIQGHRRPVFIQPRKDEDKEQDMDGNGEEG